MTTASVTNDDFALHLDRLRRAGVLRLDLTDSDPARWGLGWTRAHLDALLAEAGLAAAHPGQALVAAREAVASYLAGHRVSVAPDRIFFAPSRSAARALALSAVADSGDEVLVPSPARPLLELAEGGVAARSYALAFGEEWRIDLRSLRRAVSPRTSAVLVGNPAEPTGALLAPDELEALDELCGGRELALVGDESFLDTAHGASVSVARAGRALSLHVSGLAGVCGLAGLGAEWVAVGGPEALAAPAAARLGASASHAPVPVATLAALPTLLARRGTFLEALRARLARNRGAIAAASLREAPWTLQWGGGGWWAVLQINAFRDESELCSELLDEGIAIEPGHRVGLPPTGHLVVSLLPAPHLFDTALERLEAHLRGRG
jgi:aspartate/methionine/tyrosine aminotransferase